MTEYFVENRLLTLSGNIRFQPKFQNNVCNRGLSKKTTFLYGLVSPNFCARDNIKLIRIACQAAMSWFKFTNIKTAVILIASVAISDTPCSKHIGSMYITVPVGAEAPSGHMAQA